MGLSPAGAGFGPFCFEERYACEHDSTPVLWTASVWRCHGPKVGSYEKHEMISTPTVTPEAALLLGWSIIPTGPDKRPLLTSWKPYQYRSPTGEEFQAWMRLHPAAWAVVTGAISGRITLDFDGEEGRHTMETLGLEPHRSTPSGGSHVDFHYPRWSVQTLNGKAKRDLGKRWPGLDIRADGGYALFTGQTHGGEYRWLRDPEPYSLDILPVNLREYLGLARPPEPTPSSNGNSGTSSGGDRVDAERLVHMALDRARAEGRNNVGMWLACQLRDNSYSESEANSVMRSYCGSVPNVNFKGDHDPYTELEALATVRQAYTRPPRDAWANTKVVSLPTVNRADTTTGDLISPPFNDFGNACRLIALYGERIRYCHAFASWLTFTDSHWSVDRVDAARSLAQECMLEFARQALARSNEAASKFAGRCLNSQRLTAMLREAQPHLAITPEQLDTDSAVLNFLNGTVDLRTGELRRHSAGDYITKLVRYRYQPGTAYPRFTRFIQQMLPGLDDYLQRAIGYSLTGFTSEKAAFVCHGTGNNGKTTLLSTLLRILEDYAVLLQVDTLMVRRESNNTQADLADLRGARFVMTSETEEGQRLAEGKLKRITQGMGRIKAVRKYENPIEFPETHKLWLDCNHRPGIRGRDNAIWNRLHLIPFQVTVSADECDRELPAKLLVEGEGILAWAVAGSVRWFREGLGKPDTVESAGREWRSESDQIRRFIEEICVAGEYSQSKARPLYIAYRRWADEAREHAMAESEFSNALGDLKYSKKHTKSGTVYQGIGFRAEPAERVTGDDQ